MISAVVLTHNSATTLAATLASINWCDEVIIIDDGSTDATLAIAKKHNATIIAHPLENDFAAQRNVGLDRARGEWVLYLDSDEVVSAELASELMLLSKQKSDIVGYSIRRQDWMWGKPLRFGETQGVSLLRFGKRMQGAWVHPVHEVWQMKGIVGTTRNALRHFPHPTVSDFLASIDRYSTIRAQYLFGMRAPSRPWHIVVYPAAKFFVNYIGKSGWRDGTAGAIIAFMMSMHSFLVRAKLWLLYTHKNS